MRCSICGEDGHNKRSCLKASNNEVRDNAIHLRIDQLTEKEQHRLGNELRKLKIKIAPNARATLIEGKQNQLPYRPVRAIEDNNEN